MSRDKKSWALVGIVVVALVSLPIVVEPVRLLYAVAFFLLVPGCGWAYRAAVVDTVDKIALAVVISMSATILVATTMVATNSWSVPVGVAVLAAFATLGFVPFDQASGSWLPSRNRLSPRLSSRPRATAAGDDNASGPR